MTEHRIRSEGGSAFDAEWAFVLQCVKLWAVVAALCLFLGNSLALVLSDCASNLLGTFALSLGFFVLSLPVCVGVCQKLWRDVNLRPLLMAFAIPLGANGFLSIGGLIIFGRGYLDLIVGEMCGMSFSGGLLLAGALFWGAAVRTRRDRAFKRLGIG